MRFSDEWWTSPQESESGQLIMVTGRDALDKIIASGKYRYRVDVDWKYEPLANGMPNEHDSKLMEEATDCFLEAFQKDPIALLTGIYTGAGERNWVFYTQSLGIFSKVFNRALQDMEMLPLEISAEEDPDWEEYHNMREISYIPPETE